MVVPVVVVVVVMFVVVLVVVVVLVAIDRNIVSSEVELVFVVWVVGPQCCGHRPIAPGAQDSPVFEPRSACRPTSWN